MPRVCICFASCTSKLMSKSFGNRVAKWMAKHPNPMIHCEILFPDKDDGTCTSEEQIGKACSVRYGEQVFFHNKKFSAQYWAFRSIEVTKEQYDKMRDFCRDRKEQRFNRMGYYANIMPHFINKRFKWYASEGKKSWYCTEIVAAALKHGGVLPDDQCISIHPDSLYHIVFPMTFADCRRPNGAERVRI